MTSIRSLRRTPGVRALVADAVRAPSSHNTQPWRFRIGASRIDLYADRTRRLPVNDPDDRELIISGGAALANLLISAAQHGWSPSVRLWPPGDRDHLAIVELAPALEPADHRLWPAIEARATHRRAFRSQPLPSALVAPIVAAGDRRAVWVKLLSEEQRSPVGELVAAGDRLLFADATWRRELASWMRPHRRGDGLAVPPVFGAVFRQVVARADLGRRIAAADRSLVDAAPALIVLGTDEDDKDSWVHAGLALQHLLLAAALDGIQAGFLNQPCQVASLRSTLAELVGRPYPQVVLRLGYPAATPRASARRSLDEVIDDVNDAGTMPAG